MGDTNEHGHRIVTFTGLNLSGKEDLTRLEESNYHISDDSKSLFLSEDYEKYGRLEQCIYKVVIVPGVVFQDEMIHTNIAMSHLATKKYGYENPLAGMVPRVREVLSDEMMKRLGIMYVVFLHEPIPDNGGCRRVLYIDRNDEGRFIRSVGVKPQPNIWRGKVAFAFSVTE